MLIHIARDRRELGQFTTEELQLQLTNRTIKPTDYAWTEGMESWQLVHEVFKIEWPRHQHDDNTSAADQKGGTP